MRSGGRSIANGCKQPYPSRAPSEVPGLDAIVGGGLIPGTTYIVQGGPGTGKTILANQLAFNRAAYGERTLYVTQLTEAHDMLLQNLQSMDFYDQEHVHQSIRYVSAYNDIEHEGLEGLFRLLSRESKAQGASTIVLDGLFMLAQAAASEQAFNTCINRICSLANLAGITLLLLTNSSRGPDSPEFTQTDGWIELTLKQLASRTYRHIEVHKCRGSDINLGKHLFTISDAGLRILPRLESTTTALPIPGPHEVRISTGVPDLDVMLDGGLIQGSTTLLTGATGTGKTSLGMHFVACCSGTSPGLVFSFNESPQQLTFQSQFIGLNLAPLVQQQAITIIHAPELENLLDDIGYRILAAVRESGARCLFVDGLDAIQQSSVHHQRLAAFFEALARLLASEGVTSIFTLQTPDPIHAPQDSPYHALSRIADNIVSLRSRVEGDRLMRDLSIIKTRGSGFDHAIRDISITRKGLRLSGKTPPSDG